MALLYKKGTARSTLAHLPASPESHAQCPSRFHMALKEKPPLLWQEDPAKAQHLSQAVLL